MPTRDWREWCIHDEAQIAGFKGPFEFLCNFYPCINHVMCFDGNFVMPDVEHAYQFAKLEPNEQSAALSQHVFRLSAGDAKKWGQTIPKRRDWDEIKTTVMQHCVFSKFLRHKELRDRLVATGSRRLVERNWWKDTFWGTNLRGEGTNVLGHILMDTRDYWRSSVYGRES